MKEKEYEYLYIKNQFIVAKDKVSNLYGVLNKYTYEIAIPFVYKEICLKNAQFWALAEKDKKWGIINMNNEIILPFEFEKIDVFGWDDNGKYECYRKNKVGIFDVYQQEFIVPIELNCIEQSIMIDKTEYYIFEKKGLNAFVKMEDNKINYLTDFIFDLVYDEDCSYERLSVRQNNLWGIIDLDGKMIIPCLYDCIYYVGDGGIKAKKGNEHFCFDLNGNFIKNV